ncbi:MAG: TRAP transporter large permease, partial [Octadecabacter sp.]
MELSTLVTLISIGVTILFMLGVPVFLVIAYWVLGTSIALGQPLVNIGTALSDV